MDIREYIKEHLLIFDGAMGTYFIKKSTNPQEKCELANLTQEEIVYSIHKEYIAAGCKAIKTNTFGANRINFGGDEELLKEVIKKGYEISCKAAGDDVFVFADLGPIEEDGVADGFDEFKFVVDCFIELGAKNFLFETLSSDRYLANIASYIKQRVDEAFIITSFAVQPDGYTRDGYFGRDIFRRMVDVKDVEALGLNCVSGPYHMLHYVKELNLKNVTLSVMPNAGYPTVVNNRTLFNASPEYFGTKMADIVRQGAAIIGGCCGTTPEYLRETALNVMQVTGDEIIVSSVSANKIIDKEKRENKFISKLERGKRVLAIELDPPVDTEIGKFLENAKKIKEVGADIITIADCPVGRPRVDSSLLACKLKRELNIDILPHITCRDRNLNATKALLLGLNIEGVDNVLVVTGDPIPSAQRDEVKSVFNFNSRMLARYIDTLNETIFSSPFGICAALNVNAPNFDIQLKIAREKVENGVKVFLTQPIMTEKGLENLKRANEELSAKILAGIMPVVSYRNACFMNNEISGIDVGEKIIKLYENKTPEECRELAVSVSVSMANEVMPYCNGLYIITPFSRADIVCDIVNALKSFEN
ncbi:MAG: bifunctional homocysteine S-methyltransferase/methylenetetrahydrofolate reductase [Lachnospiraceae bacterium]|nr:bifunctional homocysteine S-methyltransferase/methylenetetrahydrofolate reductase [Lachnospiraceae bacterium]